MNDRHGRDLDLNLLRVFLAVAESGSVTQAAASLYLTQPAVSAALRRLTRAIGAPVFTRQGRGIALTSRGARLEAELRPHLQAIVDATLAPAVFDPATSDRTHRLGLADNAEQWLLPALVRRMTREAPRMRLVALPVNFRTVGEALALRRIDAAITVADELPPSVRRRPLFAGAFCCLYDPRHLRAGRRLDEKAYFEAEHVIVSYNGDLRGFVEDALHRTRKVRCSLPSFASVGSVIEGSALVATVPRVVADDLRRRHPALRTSPLPIAVPSGMAELLWPAAVDDDDACRWLRDAIVTLVRARTRAPSPAAAPE